MSDINWEEDCLKFHGRVLTGMHRHWCIEYDDLPIDDTCPEFESCLCYITTNPTTTAQTDEIVE